MGIGAYVGDYVVKWEEKAVKELEKTIEETKSSNRRRYGGEGVTALAADWLTAYRDQCGSILKADVTCEGCGKEIVANENNVLPLGLTPTSISGLVRRSTERMRLLSFSLLSQTFNEIHRSVVVEIPGGVIFLSVVPLSYASSIRGVVCSVLISTKVVDTSI